ncbi:hypothetical protein MADA3029_540008 [Vibrio nigripulchritudo MADA3029]|nr:hypothetical protein VIBNIFTn2_1030040 [Vibrio nigripulchritudo FTn2]CCN50215.1 hypothetical protein VIBNIMADA3020_890008 [Vibrio nigripulchritudo MADA3020]CCN53357.1 hypothetical protein VIBNIMADA3021_290084 [Vibrio nigripulchritudo MADA3021]CCN60155.1 hypothetical protein MADA3029_540008 [Vibrio nigripulchritudo MADA3029]CCN64390.1 hypothetical protein VIBNIPon4_210040 [Vibrio nigripulchritudo POn4]
MVRKATNIVPRTLGVPVPRAVRLIRGAVVVEAVAEEEISGHKKSTRIGFKRVCRATRCPSI